MYHPAHHAKANPQRAAIIMAETGETLSYGALEQHANQGAQLFRKLGLKRGDTVALLMENHLRYFEICFAAQRAGLYYTPLSTSLSVSEAAYIVENSRAKVLITSAAMATVAAELAASNQAGPNRYAVDGFVEGFEPWEDAIASMPATPIADESPGRDMLYSSGTTGRPKGICFPLPEGAIDALTPQLQMWQRYGADTNTVLLSPAPMYHTAPLRSIMSVLRLGGTVVAMERFDAKAALALIERYRITHSQWVPTMFVRMLKLGAEERAGFDLSSHTHALHGAAPCPVQVKEQMIEWWGPILYEYYTATESIGYVACNSQEWLAHKGTVGKGVGGAIHILDDDDRELPVGEAGTVYFEVTGPGFAYLGDAAKTDSIRSRQGWQTMGDIGYLDKDGYLYLTDRKAFLIISGGVNIYPQEIENLLVTHPKVADAAVIGVPNTEFGEEVKAVVQPMDMRDAGPALEQELLAFCREHISKIKAPRSVDFLEALPRLPTGKLVKRDLRAKYWVGAGRSI